VVLDGRVEKGQGVIAECVVRSGIFQKGGYVVVDCDYGRVKLLKDVNNKQINTAGPSQPVRITGLKSPPSAGDSILCVDSEERAKEIVDKRIAIQNATNRQTSTRPPRRVDALGDLQVMNVKTAIDRKKILKRFGLDDDRHQRDDGTVEGEADPIRIPIMIRSDADGTLAAVEGALLAIAEESQHRLIIDPIKSGVGPPSASDVRMAQESNAPIFSFNVHPEREVTRLAEKNGVVVKSDNIIYSLLDDAKVVFASYLPTVLRDRVHGKALVQMVFSLNNKKDSTNVAGCRIEDGTIYRNECPDGNDVQFRVLRKGQVIAGCDIDEENVNMNKTLRASSIRKVKEDVLKIKRGEECGIGLQNFDAFEEGDVIECFTREKTAVFM